MENAVMVCPEGNENLSRGKTFDQQCGSNWHGRTRWLRCFKALKISTPTSAAKPAAPTAASRCGPPQASSMIPTPYHSQPSPRRVDRIIQMRNHRGARQRFICRMTRWSRFSMNPHSMRVTVTDSPHAEAPNEGPREDSNEMPNEKCSGIKSCACGATSHKCWVRFSESSSIADHFREKRISFSQCPAVKNGTSNASGEIASVQGFSCNRELMMLKTSAVSFA